MPGANRLHGAGLRPLLAFLLNESHHRADLETVKPPVEDAVSVEVNFPSAGRSQKPIPCRREQLADRCAWDGLVGLHISSLASSKILQPSSHRLERIVNRLAKLLVRGTHLQVFHGPVLVSLLYSR